jgi:lipopolysaccharide export system permease protein
MLILDRYLLRNFLKGYFASLVVFISLFIIGDIFTSLQDMLQNHPPIIKIVECYLYGIPLFFSQTSPMAALLATLFTLSQLNQSNEIIAMRSSGLSIYQIIRPLIAFGLTLSLAILLINEMVLPHSQKMNQWIKRFVIERPTGGQSDQAVENVAVYGFNNRLFFINKLFPKSNRIEGLTILEHDSQQNVKSKIYAEKAEWRNNRWVLYQCYIYHLGDGKKIKSEPLYFSDTVFKIEETPADFLRQNVAVENMNIRELAGYISRLSQSRETTTVKRLLVDLYQKTSFPFTSLIIILIGIPSSIVIRRRAIAFSSISLCIAISFFFYVAFAVSIALGKGGAVPPFVAAWMSHVLFGSVALILISRIP